MRYFNIVYTYYDYKNDIEAQNHYFLLLLLKLSLLYFCIYIYILFTPYVMKKMVSWKSRGNGVQSSLPAIDGLAVSFPGNNEGWIVGQDIDVGTMAMPQLTMGCWVKSEGFNYPIENNEAVAFSNPIQYVLSSSHAGSFGRGFGIRTTGTHKVRRTHVCVICILK